MGMKRFRSIVSEIDFNNTIHAHILSNKLAEGVTLKNAWSFNANYQASHINVDTTKKGSVEIPLGYLRIGDKVKLRCEVMNVAGEKARLALDRSLTDPAGVGGSLFQTQSSKSGVFETMEFTAIIYQDAYYRMTGGLFTADAGEFYIRKCEADIETIVNESQSYNTFKDSFKRFTIQVASGTTGVFTVNNASTFDNATITIDSSLKCIYIDYTVPFTYTGKNPVAIISQDGTVNSKLYEFKNRTSSATRLRVEVFDKATNTLIDPATVAGLIYFHVLIAGYDYV